MINYKNGKIYKILDFTNNNFYVGSTTKQYLSQRLEKHKNYYKEYEKGRGGYITSMEILDNCNYQIFLLEDYPCNSKDALRTREQYYIDKLRCDKMVNKTNAKGLNREKEKHRKINGREKIKCEKCNSVVCKDWYKRHRKTYNCINALPRGIINLICSDDEEVIKKILL